MKLTLPCLRFPEHPDAADGRTPQTGDAASRPLITRILLLPAAFRHPHAWGGALLASGLWLFILGAILCGVRYWWGGLLIAVAALQIWAAYLLLTDAQSHRAAGTGRTGHSGVT